MIIGIGNDLMDIRRIERTLKRFGSRFEQRVFTETERAKAARRAGAGPKVVAGTYAKRFAAKEACAKALGTGMMRGVRWCDIEVINLPSGQPTILLHGAASALARQLMPEGHSPHIHVTLTDDFPLAQAFVVLEARRN